MAEPENLIVEPLRHMRGQLDRVDHRPEDIVVGLGRVERTTADHSVQLAGINTKLDRLDARVPRIE
jgi:hypothetical protein